MTYVPSRIGRVASKFPYFSLFFAWRFQTSPLYLSLPITLETFFRANFHCCILHQLILYIFEYRLRSWPYIYITLIITWYFKTKTMNST